jgi:hypothetical protein
METADTQPERPTEGDAVAVPRQVREAALAALNAARSDLPVLAITHDTALDGSLPALPDAPQARRSVVFGAEGLSVRVDVVPHDGATDEGTLVVHLDPPGRYRVEALSPDDAHLSVAAVGSSPLRLRAWTGPFSLLVVDLEAPTPGRRTAWLTL